MILYPIYIYIYIYIYVVYNKYIVYNYKMSNYILKSGNLETNKNIK